MLLSFWLTLLAYLSTFPISALGSESPIDDRKVEIKIGFLVRSKCLKHKQSYQQLYVFHHALNKMNQLYSNPRSGNAKAINFVPVIAETFGDESASIKQTIALITRQAVNFIVGPQETCQVESQLASIFNVAMISHYCSHWSPFNSKPDSDRQPSIASGHPMTFIQTKPPHWKIVERVVTLVGQLLGAYGRYPQNLVLLYFKEPSSGSEIRNGSPNRIHPANATANSSEAEPNRAQTKQQPANDAIQYKLIGELLEIKLNELLNSWRQSAGGRGGGAEAAGSAKRKRRAPLRPLAVLNWHTTFHYGYTKNPFRRLIRRHLFQQQSAAINQCDSVLSSLATNLSKTTTPTMATGKAWSHPEERAAIYIVVGHYYEHLGLMMALSELDLLSGGNSFAETDRNQQSSGSLVPANQLSVVIGVDTKEYDERDDSVGFLRGLLMGAANDDNREHHNFRSAPTSSTGAADQLDRIAVMYRHYLGVVPAKPTRMAELLDEIRQSLRNQTTNSVSSTRAASEQRLRGAPNESNNNSGGSISDQPPIQANVGANQSTLDALPLTDGLLQFMRLPVEAFYLYDSMALLGAYFGECIQLNQLSLENCSDGRRAREWFNNRVYTSFVNHNRTSFDSQAQTEGLYTLIARRASPSGLNQPDTSETGNDDEFDLIPVGQFASVNRDSIEQKIDLFADYDSIDSVWLPFWCFVRRSNNTLCANLLSEPQTNQDEVGPEAPFTHIIVLCLILTIAVSLLLLAGHRMSEGFTELRFTNANHANLGWFDEQDERNFLKIVYSHLLTPEILHESDDNDQNPDEGIISGNKIMVELHCHMFPFPSCRFVHWLTALHQLKEMMFQYQPSINVEVPDSTSRWSALLKKSPNNNQSQASSSRGFFVNKHKGTNSLKLLLNKYKSINECFCCLSDLSHKSVVRLYGATLLFNDYGKTARLVVEQSDRGNLRDALRHLRALLSEDESEDDEVGSAGFMSMLVFSLVNDLLDGLEYLHESRTGFHGELRATTCLLATNWRLKLSGFHTAHMRRSLGDYEQKNCGLNEETLRVYLDDLVYSAPEVIENHNRRKILDVTAMRLADIYSFAFVFYELLVGQEPWSCLTQVNSSKLLIDRVKVESSFRPPLSRLDKNKQGLEQVAVGLSSASSSSPSSPSSSAACSSDRMNRIRRLHLDGVQQLLRSCWSHLADRRPQSVATLRNRLLDCCLSSKSSLDTKKIHGQVVKCYARLLESVAAYRKENLALERKRSKEFELKLLPESVVAKLRNNPRNIQRHTATRELFACRRFECVSFCSFRILIVPDDSQVEELHFLEQLNEILDQLDSLVSSYQRRIHLLDSQVDSSMRFMVYAGEPLLAGEPNADSDKEVYSHSQLIASFALQLIDLSNRWQPNLATTANMRIRCGLHCGPAIGGLLGGRPISNGGEISSKLARYVLLGSSMLWANALELNGLPQRIQVSTDFRRQLIQSCSRESLQGLIESGSRQGYVMIKREGKIYAKNLGEFESYWLLNGPRLTASQSLMLLSASSSPSRSCA